MTTVTTPLERQLYFMLKRITKDYMTTDQIKRAAKIDPSGLDYQGFLEVAYENIQNEARVAIRGLRVKRP